ncbi:helix-turn-helix transcriptional regulator [Sphingobacterium sp. UBA5996]|uniref:helix-turn-helix transcriptional regulator n=1 Tax=Sphingobacterium sp. UBA5996 TaxID=1947505 RepID=UPI0025DAC8F9|nr:diguanylate cyclase [Sphingobacterium sp. UBA5996]
MNFKNFWDIISNRHLSNDMNKRDLINLRRLNQYAFLISILFFFNAIRDLFYGLWNNFYIFSLTGIILFVLFFYTTARFKDYIVFLTLLIFCGTVFLFSSSQGFDNGLSLYYLGILLAAIFIFNESKNRIFGIIIYILIISLFYISNANDFRVLSFLHEAKLIASSKDVRIHTFFQISFFIVLNGYFVFIANNSIIELNEYKISANNIIAKLSRKMNGLDQDSILQNISKLAMADDIAFLPKFKQVFPSFHDNLMSLNPNMTVDEFKFCALLKLGFTTKDIAICNNLAVRSVQTRKGRLRKSFLLSPQEDLYNWINKI